MIDSHVHLNRTEFQDDLPAVRERARAAGVTGMLNVGYDLASSEESVVLAAGDSSILAAVGVHPHDAAMLADSEGRPTTAGQQILSRLAELAGHPRVVAIGEIGLDFYRDLSPRPAQQTALRLQLELAASVDLPVIFHIRDAYPQMLALLEEMGVPARGAVLHAFAGDAEVLTWARSHSLLVGIGGPVTYKNSRLPEVLQTGTLADILLETDAPWLPPVPYRGKRNESAYLVHTAARIGQIFAVQPDVVVRETTANFRRLFDPSGDLLLPATAAPRGEQ